MENKPRCSWCLKDDIYKAYHDEIWGEPQHDDQKLFEFINLEGAQAGLSWYTVLVKKENYRKAFDNWDATKIIYYDEAKIMELLQNPGIIRNRLKINAVISNAKAYLKIKEEFGSFDQYIWQFTNHQTIVNQFESLSEVPAKTPQSDEMSKALKKRGFKFVGSTICYAFMQATGMVNDHLLSCWKRLD
ncbi:DNA-3-methyladenine glycosylase I [Flexithrix dorotheae]|uniref:DNA-3-methyladenine glycosylase I n=1 Tax=Flexithrix dorotheae TaxID=70993 RepID=UPI00036BD1AF|nr:DNA-3-methyladenine glycosylase I [Flexithrix dorotheae]